MKKLIAYIVCTASVISALSAAGMAETNDDWARGLSGKVVFQSNRDGDWDIYLMNIDGSRVVQLTHNSAADRYPVWSPDGTTIAFESDRDGSDQIYVMNADGTNQQPLTTHSSNNRSPAWSPDGEKIAFDSDRTSNQEIFIMDSDGQNAVQWSGGLGRNILPAWSPDGTRLAYTGNRYLGWNVYVANLDKTDDQRISDGHGACRPDWSPDGAKIAYVSQRADGKGDIWLMNPDGSEKQQLTTDAATYDYYPAWSPDGKYLLYAKTPDKDQGNWEIYVMTADGARHARLTNHPARDEFPDWTAGSVSEDLYRRQQFAYEAEDLPRATGVRREDSDAAQGMAAFAGADAPVGFLTYGPYQAFSAGEYVAHFRLKTDRNAGTAPLMAIDVAADTGRTLVARRELSGQDFAEASRYQTFQLPFTLEGERLLEFRVYFFGSAAVWADSIQVEILSVPER